MAVPVSLTVNGQPQQVEVDPRLLLVHFLRDVLGWSPESLETIRNRRWEDLASVVEDQ